MLSKSASAEFVSDRFSLGLYASRFPSVAVTAFARVIGVHNGAFVHAFSKRLFEILLSH